MQNGNWVIKPIKREITFSFTDDQLSITGRITEDRVGAGMYLYINATTGRFHRIGAVEARIPAGLNENEIHALAMTFLPPFRPLAAVSPQGDDND